MLVWYALLTIFTIMVVTYIGLTVSVKIENSVAYILFWVIYLILLATVINGIAIANFWGVLQNKAGPPGPRGLSGDQGGRGFKGKCGDKCRGKEAVQAIRIAIVETLNKLDNRTKDNLIIESDIKNRVILDKINEMAQSRDFELGAEIKGPSNMIKFLVNIWKEWITLIYKASELDFLTNKDAEDTYPWKSNPDNGVLNPFDEMARYDVYHFGLKREFRPAKIEICDKPEETNYLPEQPKSRLKMITGNYYKWQFYDVKRNDKQHISFWKPSEYNTNDFVHENERYYPLGDAVYIYQGANTEFMPESVFDNENGSVNRQIGVKKFKIPNPPDVIPKFEFFSGYDYKGSRLALRAFDRTIHFANHNFYRATASVKIPDTMKLRRDKGYKNIKMKNVSVTLSGYEEERRQYLTLLHDENDLGNKRYVFIRWKWGIDGMKEDQEWEYKSDLAYLRSCSYKGNDGGPDRSYQLVTGDVKPPTDYQLLYTEKNSCGEQLTIWKPIPPDGYKALGFICQPNNNKPLSGENAPIRCLPSKCLYKTTGRPRILWTSPKGVSGEQVQLVGFTDSVSHLGNPIPGNAHHSVQVIKKGEPIPEYYYVNQQCINEIDNTKVKIPETENSKLGIGWHGHPVRESKYSVFSFLGTMPESIITNKHTNRKYYIIHSSLKKTYDGDDFKKVISQNYYLVLKYNKKTRDYDRAIAINGSNGIRIMTASSADVRQLWSVEFLENGEFRLKSKETGRYLSHQSTQNLRGELLETQVLNPPITDDKSIFFNNKSTFGTSLDTMRETNKHTKLRDTRKDINKNIEHKGRTIKGTYNPV